jgi:hypothetical protein
MGAGIGVAVGAVLQFLIRARSTKLNPIELVNTDFVVDERE